MVPCLNLCFAFSQVDLQSSEKEKERLSADVQRLQSLIHDMDNMKRENQDLSRRLSLHETVQTGQDDDLKVRMNERKRLTCFILFFTFLYPKC